MNAIIVFYNEEKNFGFARDPANESYFFHANDCENASEIAKGETIEFTAEQNVKGLKAINVRVISDNN